MRIVVDSSAFFSLEKLPQGELYTTPGVVDELRKYGDERISYWSSLIEIQEPTKGSIAKAMKAAECTGDDARLSTVDLGLIALAMDLDAAILTDDYSIQNVAKSLEIMYSPVGIDGIKELIRWKYKCIGCKRIWDENYKECPICGHSLRTSRGSRK